MHTYAVKFVNVLRKLDIATCRLKKSTCNVAYYIAYLMQVLCGNLKCIINFQYIKCLDCHKMEFIKQFDDSCLCCTCLTCDKTSKDSWNSWEFYGPRMSLFNSFICCCEELKCVILNIILWSLWRFHEVVLLYHEVWYCLNSGLNCWNIWCKERGIFFQDKKNQFACGNS